jgi:hypothetical protein
MEVLAEIAGTEREEVLDTRHHLSERLGTIGEVVRIEYQRLGAAITKYVGLILK